MEMRQIRYFVRAAEFLHFTRAAESLNVSQPTLSLHIQQLEKELGSPLFDRTGGHVRHVRLTQAGKRLLIYAYDILRSAERAKQDLADLRGLLSGTVTLGANNIFIPRLMSECVAKYSAAYPGVSVVVKMVNQEELEVDILGGKIDLALAWLPLESKDLEVEELFSDELAVVVAADHPLARLERISLAELANLPMALPTVATNIRRQVDAEIAKANLSFATSLEIDDTLARLRFVEAGNAVTIAPLSSLDNRPTIRTIPIAEARLTLVAGLVSQRGVTLGSAAQALADTIRANFPSSTADRSTGL